MYIQSYPIFFTLLKGGASPQTQRPIYSNNVLKSLSSRTAIIFGKILSFDFDGIKGLRGWMAMEKKNEKDTNFGIRKTTSMIITCLLVMSGFLVLFSISLSTVEAPLVHNMSAQWEDQDRGDGLDYNGDTVGDKKVTWHAVNNSHIVDDNFFVQDGYILEFEAGVIVQIDPGYVIQVGQTTGASLYSNGTPVAPVMIQQNASGSPWGGIYITEGSYGYMQFTGITGGGIVYILNSTLDMSYCGIGMMNSFGIYSMVSTVTLINCGIAYTAQPGIYALGSIFSVSNSYIADTLTAAMYIESSQGLIENNDIYGYNASVGMGGGHAIYLTGASPSVTISNNTIIGGKGGDDVGLGGGNGGQGIFDVNYEGQLQVVDNNLIQGGDGGNNFISIMAGDGGIGVHVIPISDAAPFPSVAISGNMKIIGGRGGDNNAVMDGYAGDGGRAIWIADNPPGSAGSAIISNNGEIIGGDGGHNFANAGLTGWTAGDGGEGIFVMDVQVLCSVLIDQNPNIKGGRGGNNSGMGNAVTAAGDGGSGILVWNSTEVTISQNIATGGHGGNNTISGMMANAGDGGSGVVLWSQMQPFFSRADIMNSFLIGGEGGDDYVGAGPIQGGPGRGGSGLYSSESTGTCTSTDLLGGKGGDNYGPSGGGGSGGYGLGISSSFDWSITGGTITGGKGGENFEPTGGGGGGGSGIYIGDNSDNIAISMVTNLVGGDGGDADTGTIGPGSAAQATIYAATSTNLDMIRNIITTGTGGYNSSSGTYGQNGTYCFYGTDLGGTIMILGNNMTTGDKSVITYGIRLNLSLSMIGDATISSNDIYDNYYGVFIKDSNTVTIGGTNNIFDNYNGIYLENSDANIGMGNTIDNNDYGIYSINSNPTISGDQIVNSSQMGLFLMLSDAVVQETSIVNSGVYNVYCNASSPKFYNGTISTPTPGPLNFAVIGNSHPWLLNTTFEKDLTIFGDQSSNITVNWFMHVRVIDVSYNPVNNAEVWVNDSYDNNLLYGQTPVDGWINWIVVTEYIENLTGGKYYYTPHNVSAWEGGRFGMNLPAMIKSRFVIVMLDGIAFDIMLREGWNMISIPVNLTDTTLEEVLKAIDGNYIAVQWFDINDPKDQWKHYHIDKVGMNDLADIDRWMGIWIFMKMDDILPVVGPIPVPSITDIDLKAGWNFVGYPSLTIRNAGNASGEAFESISGFVDIVQYYDASDPSNIWKEWDPGTFSQDDLIDIRPGYGLWIHVTGDCTWSVDW